VIGLTFDKEIFALDGKQAVEIVKSFKCKVCGSSFELLLMDLNMPVMDGY